MAIQNPYLRQPFFGNSTVSGSQAVQKLNDMPAGTILSIQTNNLRGKLIQWFTGGPATHNVILVDIPDVEGGKHRVIAEQDGTDVKKSRLVAVDEFVDRSKKKKHSVSAHQPPKPINYQQTLDWLKENLEKPYSNFKAAISALDWNFLCRPTPAPTHSYCSEFVVNAARAGGLVDQKAVRGFVNPNSLFFSLKNLGFSNAEPIINGGVPKVKLHKPLYGPLRKAANFVIWLATGLCLLAFSGLRATGRVLSWPLRMLYRHNPFRKAPVKPDIIWKEGKGAVVKKPLLG